MIDDLLDSVLGGKGEEEGKHKSILILLIVVGIVLFVLLSKSKLFQKKEDEFCDVVYT